MRGKEIGVNIKDKATGGQQFRSKGKNLPERLPSDFDDNIQNTSCCYTAKRQS
jgi:hypothetical protein